MTKKNMVSSLGVILLEDWLIKSPPFQKLKNIKSWHKRYFALLRINRSQYIVPKNWSKKGPKSLEDLHDVYLVYWESKHDRDKGIKPIRTIPLFKDYSIEDTQPPYFQEKFRYVLALNTIERKYYLCVDDQQQKEIWKDVLTQSLQLVQQGKDMYELAKEPIYETILELLNKTSNNNRKSAEEGLSEPSTPSWHEIRNNQPIKQACIRSKSLDCKDRAMSRDKYIRRASEAHCQIRKTDSTPTNVDCSRERTVSDVTSCEASEENEEPVYHILEKEDERFESDPADGKGYSVITFQGLVIHVPMHHYLQVTTADSLTIKTPKCDYVITAKCSDMADLQWV